MEEAMAQAATALSRLAERPVWSLAGDDLVSALATVETMSAQLTLVAAALVRELDVQAIPASHGASSMPVWLRENLRVSIHRARRLATLAQLIDARPALHDALVDGVINPEQAEVIGAALADLPHDLDPAVRDKAEAALIDSARQFEPAILRRLGERILAHVAPDIADEALRRKLDREEARAYIDRVLTITAAGPGRFRLAGWLDTESASVVSTALDPLCKPAPADGVRDPRTPGQRRADALTEVCRLALASDQIPVAGGESTRLVVTVGLDPLSRQLSGQFGAGMLDTGQPLSPAAVRRLACDAQVIPAVLGGDGAVLDLGRTRRLFTGATRRALAVRDGGCAFPGCDRPTRWCEGHHIQSWLDGGATDLDNGVLLCGYHHRVIHQGHWQVRLGGDRRPEFVPPVYLDLEQRPRRNEYHRRT